MRIGVIVQKYSPSESEILRMARSTTLTAQVPVAGNFAALKDNNFRLYFIGQLISTSGTWMQTVAQGYLVFQLTRSELWLGIIACAAGLPMLFIAPFAGVLVERLSRRRVLIATQTILMILALTLAFLVFTDTVEIWHIVVLALGLGITNAFDAPARQTFISDLVSSEHLQGGIALNSIIVNGSRVLGPTIAGIILTLLGPAWCFFLNGISYIAVILTMVLIRLQAHVPPTTPLEPLTQLREGFSYVRQHPVVLPLLLLAGIGGFFFWANIALFPAFADTVLHSPKDGYAIMSATDGMGAVLVGLLIAALVRRFGRGHIITYMAIGAALSLVLLSQTRSIPMAALICLMFGFCGIGYFVSLNTAIQLIIPAEFRGRVLSLYTLSIIGLNPLGSLLLGTIAERLGNPGALATYGVILGVLCMAVIVKFPQVREI